VHQTLAASIVTALVVALAGCGGEDRVPIDDDLTPKEVQTYMQEEAGIALRLDRAESDETLALLVAPDFDLWVYGADDWDNTAEQIGDLFNPAPGVRVFGPWRSYESDLLPRLGSYQVAVGFKRGLVLRYLLESEKVSRPCCEVADPGWYEDVVEKLRELTRTEEVDTDDGPGA
jgi:hypothetical protein